MRGDRMLSPRLDRVGSERVRSDPVLDLPKARAGRFASPRVRLFVPSSGWGGRRRREMLAAAGIVAVLFHVAMVGAIVEAPGLIPAFLRSPPPKPPPPPPEAELVMVKQDTPTVGGSPPPKPTPPAPKAVPQQEKSGGGSASSLEAPQGPVIPPPADNPATQPGKPDTGKTAQATPPPAPPSSAVQVNLDLDGQPGWGLVDPRTLPASPDDRYINKPAAYPRAAAMRGEEGTVYLTTLVAPDGSVQDVKIEQSSGYPDLDRAALNAISAWHYRPAMQGGQPVPSQMQEAYHFHLTR